MRITCPTCGACYAVGPDRIGAGGRTVECSSCHSRWLVRLAPQAGAASLAGGVAQRQAGAPKVLTGRDFAWERPAGAEEEVRAEAPDAAAEGEREAEAPGVEADRREVGGHGDAEPHDAGPKTGGDREAEAQANALVAGARDAPAPETGEPDGAAATPRARMAGDQEEGRLRERARPRGPEGSARAEMRTAPVPAEERPDRGRGIGIVIVLLVLLLLAALYLFGNGIPILAGSIAPVAALGPVTAGRPWARSGMRRLRPDS